MIDEVGEEYLQEMRREGVVIDDSSETQTYLRMRGGRGITWNNSVPGDAGPAKVTVLLGEKANNATAYEEYLHYQELKANNWVSVSPESSEYYMEEIKVERQVLNEAGRLKMTIVEQLELQKILQEYIDNLYDNYGIRM